MKKLLFLIMVSVSIFAEGVVVVTEHLPPLNYTTNKTKEFAKNSEITGFSTDVVREIIKRTNTKADILLMPWARAYKIVQIKKNYAIYSMTRSKKREKLFKWVGPIAQKESNLYALKGSKIVLHSLEEARKYKIATVKDDSKEQFLKEHGLGDSLQSLPKWDLAIKVLKAKRVDLIAATNFDLPILAKNNGYKGTDFKPVLTLQTYSLYIGFSKNTSDKIVAKWQKALDDMKADGTFEKLVNKWAKKFSADWVFKDGVIKGK